jgi:hypothetical protein
MEELDRARACAKPVVWPLPERLSLTKFAVILVFTVRREQVLNEVKVTTNKLPLVEGKTYKKLVWRTGSMEPFLKFLEKNPRCSQ